MSEAIIESNRDSKTESTPQAPLPRLAFTLRETAAVIGVSYITAFRLCQRGLLRSSGALRTKLISKAEIERFLKA